MTPRSADLPTLLFPENCAFEIAERIASGNYGDAENLHNLCMKALNDEGKLPSSPLAACMLSARDVAIQHPKKLLSVDHLGNPCLADLQSSVLACCIRSSLAKLGFAFQEQHAAFLTQYPAIPYKAFEDDPELFELLLNSPFAPPADDFRVHLLHSDLSRSHLARLYQTGLLTPAHENCIHGFCACLLRGTASGSNFAATCEALIGLAQEDSPAGAEGSGWLHHLSFNPLALGSLSRRVCAAASSAYEARQIKDSAASPDAPRQRCGL